MTLLQRTLNSCLINMRRVARLWSEPVLDIHRFKFSCIPPGSARHTVGVQWSCLGRNGRHRSGADSRQRKIIAISSGRGSVSKPFLERRAYFYDMSKSALKLGMRKLQRNVAGRRVLIGIFAPGIVDTDLNNGLRNGVPAIRKLITPEERLPAS